MDCINELVREIKDNTNKSINTAIDGLELTLGTLTSTGLKVDNFKYEINDYLVLEHLKLKDKYNKKELISNEEHSHSVTDASCSTNTHSHEIYTPKEIKHLRSGDRVLVAQVGNDFIVIGRISNA